jgi:hypothetical protein
LRDAFIASLNANIQAGHAVNNPSIALSFPLGDSREDRQQRISAALVTLQNMDRPGVGCPAASTTLQVRFCPSLTNIHYQTLSHRW